MSIDTCEFCEGTVEHQHIRARFPFRGQTIYVDHVPAWVCTKCGGNYLGRLRAPMSSAFPAFLGRE